MGAGIAAHLANAGMKVTLLDLDAAQARAGLDRQVRSGGFMDPHFADRITTGSTAQDLPALADADWVIEAVAEQLQVKQMLYAEIARYGRSDCVVSSNTSTIPLASLTQGMPEAMQERLLITHFFNPPRRMQLLELVAGPRTDPAITERMAWVSDVQLGKQVVRCKDTPGFMANRIGTFWMLAALDGLNEAPIAIERADAHLSRGFGVPPTGAFGLMDLIGLDLLASIGEGLQRDLPAGDPIQAFDAEAGPLGRLVAQGQYGRKTGGGFYRLAADRSREVLDLATAGYRPVDMAADEFVDSDLRASLGATGAEAGWAASVMTQTLSYAASLVPEIADDPASVDLSMRAGYGWTRGPFEMIDALGADWFSSHLAARGRPVPPYLRTAARSGPFTAIAGGLKQVLDPSGTYAPLPRASGKLDLAELREARPPVWSSPRAALWDSGDGIAILEMTGRTNALGPDLLHDISFALERSARDFSALVIHGSGRHFSVGADLKAMLAAADRDLAAAADFLELGRRTLMAVESAPIPVVAAARGSALGGGCELLMHCHAVQAHAELAVGLVEARVGLLPGWGGCAQLLGRIGGAQAYALLVDSVVSGSAFEARRLGLLDAQDGVTMNGERLLFDARQRALTLVRSPSPRAAPTVVERDMPDRADATGHATPHDRVIATRIAEVLASPDLQTARNREAEAFMALLASPLSRNRMRHMLATGKPLKN